MHKKYVAKLVEMFNLLRQKICCRLSVSWPKLLIIVTAAICVLYYPLGGLLNEKIDRDENLNLPVGKSYSRSLQTITFLINREVNDHIWTPNLPLFFPSYFLDNMPNFQTGLMSALAVSSSLLNLQISCPTESKDVPRPANATKLLAYPADVWLFAADNKLKIAPSSSSQYRKARKMWQQIDTALAGNKCFWPKNDDGLAALASGIAADLGKTARSLEQQSFEGASDWIDYKADDAFYRAAGKSYAYWQFLNGLAQDYKEILVAKNLYAEWTEATGALANANAVQPWVVRNGAADSAFSPNHLIILAYHLQKCENILMKISLDLKGK